VNDIRNETNEMNLITKIKTMEKTNKKKTKYSWQNTNYDWNRKTNIVERINNEDTNR